MKFEEINPATYMKKLFLIILLLLSLTTAIAKSKQEINILADATSQRFLKEVVGGQAFLDAAAAVMIFPQVLKAGLGIGGEYGEGVLRQGGQNIGYYSTAAASIGFQAGAQSKSVVVVFMTQSALNDFRSKKGWKVGVLVRTSIPWISKTRWSALFSVTKA